jgi:hypothetical protein
LKKNNTFREATLPDFKTHYGYCNRDSVELMKKKRSSSRKQKTDYSSKPIPVLAYVIFNKGVKVIIGKRMVLSENAIGNLGYL